ncbi:MAG: type II toxin-antitoxin system YafQ family toxin [Gammaproteobacteria bacterium]
MRTIERSTAFKRDYKREKRGQHRSDVESLLTTTIRDLALNLPLAPQLRDHDLIGEFLGYRECHLKPDLLLIYQITEDDVLRLVRLGSHSELFR